MVGMSDAATKDRTGESPVTTFNRSSGVALDGFYRNSINGVGFFVDAANWVTNQARTGLGYDPVLEPVGGSAHLARLYESYADNIAPDLNTVPEGDFEKSLAYAGGLAGDVVGAFAPLGAAQKIKTVAGGVTATATLTAAKEAKILATPAQKEILKEGQNMWKSVLRAGAELLETGSRFAKSEAGGFNWKFWSKGADDAAEAGAKTAGPGLHAGAETAETAAKGISTKADLQKLLDSEASKAYQNSRKTIPGTSIPRPLSKGSLKSDSYTTALTKDATSNMPEGLKLSSTEVNDMVKSAITKAEKGGLGRKTLAAGGTTLAFGAAATKIAIKPVKLAWNHKLITTGALVGYDVYEGDGLDKTTSVVQTGVNAAQGLYGKIDGLAAEEKTPADDQVSNTNAAPTAPEEDVSDKIIEQLFKGDVAGLAKTAFTASAGGDHNILNIGMDKLSGIFKMASEFLQDVTHWSPEVTNTIVGLATFGLLRKGAGIGADMTGFNKVPLSGLAITLGTGILSYNLASNSTPEESKPANNPNAPSSLSLAG